MTSPLLQQHKHRGIILEKLPSGKWFRIRTSLTTGKVLRQYFFEIKCSRCGEPSFTSGTRSPRTKHHFCTHECKTLFFTGLNHPGWKNGFTNSNGHRYVRSDHPKARRGYVAEHVLVAEKSLGRYLRKDEIVHHIDMDKGNNSPDNLAVLSNNNAHSSAHQSVNGIIAGLIKAGLVWFDQKQNKYKSKHGEKEIYGRKENIQHRKWRRDFLNRHGRAYGKKTRGPICSVASSYRKPLR